MQPPRELLQWVRKGFLQASSFPSSFPLAIPTTCARMEQIPARLEAREANLKTVLVARLGELAAAYTGS